MGEENKCLLFRKPKSLIGKSIGHCDVDTTSTNCEGDVNLCEKPESLIGGERSSLGLTILFFVVILRVKRSV